ncbi:hypothetical protein B0T17DRAFT_510538 [Bombardia bombarda]|uniref:Uncharacterized protein n=1 Tax=Bombardia bombarda TaxID=252184 RepID=A0AA39WIE7_9PEZI|nr:hypothetical protein B0T17DRAFT_510538 [Bombardia bombarda]
MQGEVNADRMVSASSKSSTAATVRILVRGSRLESGRTDRCRSAGQGQRASRNWADQSDDGSQSPKVMSYGKDRQRASSGPVLDGKANGSCWRCRWCAASTRRRLTTVWRESRLGATFARAGFPIRDNEMVRGCGSTTVGGPKR